MLTSLTPKSNIPERKSVEEVAQILHVDDDKGILSRAIARLGDDAKFPFEAVTRLENKYPKVRMSTRTDATGTLWGKSYGEIAAGMEDLFSYVWDVCSDERMADHRKDNGSLVKKLDTCNVSRRQILISEYKVAPGIRNRWCRQQFSWFKLENGWHGNEAVVISFDPAEVEEGRDYGITRGAVLCLVHCSYLLEKIGTDVTKFTMIFSTNMGGNIPQWIVKSAILPVHLVWVAEIQTRFVTIKQRGGAASSLAMKAVGEKEELRRQSFSDRVSAEILEIEESLEVEGLGKSEETEMKLATFRKMQNEDRELE